MKPKSLIMNLATLPLPYLALPVPMPGASTQGALLFIRMPDGLFPERGQNGELRATSGPVEYIFKKAPL